MNTELEKDIFNHMLAIHDFDSFGRAIAYSLLQKALDEIRENNGSEKNAFDLAVRVEKWGSETKCWKIQVGDIWIQIPDSQ